MSANKAILDHVAIDHVQKDFTAWVANKLAFHVLQVITYNFTVQNINETTVSRGNEQCAKNRKIVLVVKRLPKAKINVFETVTPTLSDCPFRGFNSKKKIWAKSTASLN